MNVHVQCSFLGSVILQLNLQDLRSGRNSHTIFYSTCSSAEYSIQSDYSGNIFKGPAFKLSLKSFHPLFHLDLNETRAGLLNEQTVSFQTTNLCFTSVQFNRHCIAVKCLSGSLRMLPKASHTTVQREAVDTRAQKLPAFCSINAIQSLLL